MELCVLCFGLLIGPQLTAADTPGLKQIQWLLSGRMSCVPDVSFAYTDVRDAAEAVRRSLRLAEAGGQRIIVHNGVRKMADVAGALGQEFAWLGYRVPTRVAFFVELWVASFFNWDLQPLLKKCGIHFIIRSTKISFRQRDLDVREQWNDKRALLEAESILGLSGLRSPEESTVAAAHDLVRRGRVGKTPSYAQQHGR